VQVAAAAIDAVAIFSAVFASFAVATVLTRRALWGHVAACLTALGATHSLAGLYPLWTYPNFNANGQIGLHAGIVAIALVLGRFPGAAGFALGILPCVHLSVASLVWPWALVEIVRSRRETPFVGRSLLDGFVLGGAVSAALAISLATRGVDPALAPYDVESDGGAARAYFMRALDVHRTAIPLGTPAYLLGPVLYFALVASLGRAEGAARSLFLLGIWIWVPLALMALAQAAGAALPDALLTWMPGRASNLTAALVPPLIAAVCADASRRTEARGPAIALVCACLLAMFAAALAMRRLPAPLVLPAAVGVALAARFLGPRTASTGWLRRGAVLAAIALAAWTATHSMRWPLALVGAFAAAFAVGSSWHEGSGRLATASLSVACALAAAAAVSGPTVATRWAWLSAEDLRIARWLDEHVPAEAMLAVPLTPTSAFQAKLCRPVLFDLRVLWQMTYVPTLSAVTARMLRELYGIELSSAGPGDLNTLTSQASAAWSARTEAAWRSLGARYGFRTVLAPRELELQLPTAFAADSWAIHEIP
jgi:hypothetical protein